MRLGNLILSRYSLDRGVATAVVPVTASDDAVRNFEGSVLGDSGPSRDAAVCHPDGSHSRMVSVPNTNQYVVEQIRRFLRESPSHACVFEDLINRPDELLSQEHNETRVAVAGVLFYVLDSSRPDEATIMATLKEAHFIAMTLGVLGSLPERRGELASGLVHLVSTLDRVIVDAYDGESYVMWRPS